MGIIYFAYGSNIWLDQMRRRCPESAYIGIGVLRGWQWIINERGYANVIPSTEKDFVYGMLYTLNSVDEKTLDGFEGVPVDYEKQMLSIEYLSDGDYGIVKNGQRQIECLVYVDVMRKLPAAPKAEYIVRMNFAIQDALQQGIPQEYIDSVLRPFIPITDMPN